VSEGTNGLRFDVYERIHLPDDVTGIHELEEIELVPRIQVLDQGEHAVLKGQLLLTGVYRGQNTAEAPLNLEHWIPVEITLPMNRVTRLDDISIEIDNFDVDLLSARTLNITGVLSLHGITVETADENEGAWRGEPFTAVHQREAPPDPPAEEFIPLPELEQQPYFVSGSVYTEGFETAAVNAVNEPLKVQESHRETDTVNDSIADRTFTHSAEQAQPIIDSMQAEAQERVSESSTLLEAQPSVESRPEPELAAVSKYEPQPAVVESKFEPQPAAGPESEQLSESAYEPVSFRPETDVQQQESSVSGIAAEPYLEELDAAEEDESLQSSLQPLEPVPLRVAFQSKESNPIDEQNPIGFVSLLQSSKREQAARQAAEQVAAEEHAVEQAKAAEQASGDDIEWQRLFINKGSDESEFRKIRMCIVQKDETLELIALRYSKNAKELAIHNRLSDSDVTEGQLIYIP